MNSLKNIILEQSRYYYDPSWSPDPEGESPIIDGLSKFDPMEYAWNSTTETYWVKKNTEDDDKWRNLILYSNYDKLKLIQINENISGLLKMNANFDSESAAGAMTEALFGNIENFGR